MSKQTKIEQEVRELCTQRGYEIWDNGTDCHTILIDQDMCEELVIMYHDGYERLKQREVTNQWRDALAMIKALNH